MPKMRAWLHPEEEQRSPCELRVWTRAEVSVPLLRTTKQANLAGLRSHQEETSGRGGVYLRHEALSTKIARVSHFMPDLKPCKRTSPLHWARFLPRSSYVVTRDQCFSVPFVIAFSSFLVKEKTDLFFRNCSRSRRLNSSSKN